MRCIVFVGREIATKLRCASMFLLNTGCNCFSKGSYRVLGLTVTAIPGVFDWNRLSGEPGDKVFSSMETVESLQEENCFCTRVKQC
jgi:hypothetical protein